MRAAWARHPGWVGLPFLLLLTGLARASAWRRPLGIDTGQYLYIGQTILDGGMPYADAANNKGPLLYLAFALIKLVAGQSTVLVNAAAVLSMALAALAVAGYVAAAAGRAAGVLAGVLFALLSGSIVMQADDVNSEQFGLAPMAGAWWLATRPGARWAVLAGAATGAAIAVNVVFALVVPFVAWELWRSAAPGGRLRRFAAALGGAAAVLLPIGLWLVIGGALDDAWDIIFRQVSEAGGTSGISTGAAAGRYRSLHDLLNLPMGGIWVAAAVGALVAARRRELRAPAIAALLWMAVVLLRIKTTNYEFLHHYLLGLPGMTAGIALGVASVWGAQRAERLGLAAVVVTLAVWPTVVGPQWNALRLHPWERPGAGGPYPELYAVADVLKRNTAPGDRIQAWWDPQVYWIADRRSPSRFFDSWTIQYRPDLEREQLRDLLADPPRAIALMPGEGPTFAFEQLTKQRPYRLVYDQRGARVWVLARR